MPSNFSASLRFELQFTGENLNSWGDHLNAVIRKVDYAIAGLLTLPVTTNVVLTTGTLLDDQARAAAIKFTGAGGFSVTIPSVSKIYLLMSSATAPIIVTTGAGSTVQVDNGDILWVTCDGTNVQEPGYGGLGLKAYVASVALGASGSLPATAGNAGKYVYTDGATSYWKSVVLADLTDWPATRIELEDLAAAFALNL